jgi:indole-3-pyruvate monooxygenase
MSGAELPALVIGAGPAGLATAAELSSRQVPYRLLERGASLGHSWANLYDSLTLHTGRHMSTLPRRRYPRGTPLFPTRTAFLEYLDGYAREFGIVVETGRAVRTLAREAGVWRASLGSGETVDARAVVVATGIIANPRIPAIEGREKFGGRIMHSVEYRRPGDFIGQRVLVVGVGNSGGEIGSELARAGAKVTVAVRSGAHVVPREIAGIPIQYLVYVMRKLPRGAQEWITERVQQLTEKKRGAPVLPRPAFHPLDAIPLIGFHLVDAIREGLVDLQRTGVARLTSTGVEFGDGALRDFDVVILATGFAPALGALDGLVRTDAKGFALRVDRVKSADQPDLYFVGHNYDSTGGLANIRRDAPLAAAAIAGR